MSRVPDVLTHVLVGYILGTLLSFRYARLRSAHVTLVMAGALVPDLMKIQLLVPDGLVAHVLGVPFTWSPIHTLVGSALVVGLGALFVTPAQRPLAVALLAVGAGSHHALDLLLVTASGDAYAVFWPLLEYRPPAGDLYLSSDRWPAVVAGVGALCIRIVARRRDSSLTPRE
ncbi:metal-dependent hydrolase [Haloterrigena salifodinae]|uniref:Metal-dependent hydrolase n=1 Tax=Haloterrigena salifodinae TaxID=2675099 RepID=A0A8T8E1Y1_9EURY|nr:metal-dependent hydrolase [Haloterrigena salifodinae]QRV15778.1 metal-dependent hydrolase [Haloterrigena salifodinae]